MDFDNNGIKFANCQKNMILSLALLKNNSVKCFINCLFVNCFSSPENSSIPPVCDCSLYNLRKIRSTKPKHITPLPKIKDSEIYYVPEKQNYSQNISFDEQTLHKLGINPILEAKLNKFNSANKQVITDNTGENDSKSANKYKRSDTFIPKVEDETKEPPLHLYLDIDIISENHNKQQQLEELKSMFQNFQTAEKKISECINLHIYIFSKYIDTINKTNANWGQEGQHDNLSNFQQLTEIENKCDQPTSIIKQSIYEIKQILSREDTSTEITQDDQKKINGADSNKVIDTQNSSIQFGNVKAVTSDIMYINALTTNPADINSTAVTEAADVQFHKNNSEYDDRNLFNYDSKNYNITSTSTFYEGSTMHNKIKLKTATDPTDYGDLGTTRPIDRTILSETDMTIPRIITKELANGTLLSVVDGYEKVPNSDFITNSTMSTPSNIEKNTYPIVLKTDIHEIVKSDVVNIHGNLYFSFGEKYIPARFIQQSDGELDVAIDGFSMCDHIMLVQNTSNFMKSLCKCIVNKNCT